MNNINSRRRSHQKLITILLALLSVNFLNACTTVSKVKSVAILTVYSSQNSSAQTSTPTKITSVDGVAVKGEGSVSVSEGAHTIGIACQLDNGVGLSFTIDVDFEKNLYYCFKALNPGKSCTVAYAKGNSPEHVNLTCAALR